MTIILMTLSFAGGYAFCWKQDVILDFVKTKYTEWKAKRAS